MPGQDAKHLQNASARAFLYKNLFFIRNFPPVFVKNTTYFPEKRK